METFNLDRERNIEALVDAFGKRWEIKVNKQTGLLTTRPNPDRADAVIPDEMQGQWTKSTLLVPVIRKYVTETWDKTDKHKLEAARKAEALKESTALAAKEAKAKSDKRSASN